MSDRLTVPNVGLEPAMLTLALDEHRRDSLPRLERLWTYFRNAPETVGMAPWAFQRTRHAQEAGLPPRLRPAGPDPRLDDRWKNSPEIVIENDIAWRIQTMVDFMVGQPIRILSNLPDQARALQIQAALDAVWEASGGISLLQDIALLGHVYGHADLLVRADSGAGMVAALGSQVSSLPSSDNPAHIASLAAELLRIELIEPTRGIPFQSAHDFRSLDAFAIVTTQALNTLSPDSARPARQQTTQTQLIGPGWRQLIVDGEIVEESIDTHFEGHIPVVHIQNMSQPFHYSGLSEVEPLIPLQNELNTRLSDRASRVTLQSFRMFLAKGLDQFDGTLIGPGRVFSTDNPEATIAPFGGDSDAPSESRHIEEVREALDKISGVPPLAGGVVRAKIGNLSSANALRITLISLLTRTARKRIAYGRGILEASRHVLAALDSLGILHTTPAERALRIAWPDPLPQDLTQQVAAAQAKQNLGIPHAQVLAELGYAPADPGIE